MKEIRVRFAPSPTGPLHIGGVRTALYNYLFARQRGGKFILRIEDTDQARFVPGAEEYIIESLKWCGIEFDEGVHIGGHYSPYRQSERKSIYKNYADQLVAAGFAYYAFDTPEELEKTRKDNEAHKITFQYSPSTRMAMNNSLTIPEGELKRRLSEGQHYVIRIKIPENEEIIVNDLIRGLVTVHSDLLDDKVLYKSDGMPTYHLANVVDDYLMKISHVIRGEEWLPSAPLHVLLYRYLGWENDMPEYAHLPLLLKPDGNGKLSKRDGDRLGFPVFPLHWTDPKTGEVSSGYRESGYLPDAFINMLALLGWNAGTEQEIFSIDELIQSFSIERVGKSGAKYDPEKARWFNHHYMAALPDKELANHLLSILKEKGIIETPQHATRVCALIKERVVLLPDLWEQSWFFFQAPETYDEKVIQKIWKSDSRGILRVFMKKLLEVNPFIAPEIEASAKELINETGIGMGQLMMPFRLTIVGTNAGPGMFEMAELIGKEQILERLRLGVEKIAPD
jgi:glutamyl-tRNA synthetase